MSIALYAGVGAAVIVGIALLERLAVKVLNPTLRSVERSVPALDVRHEDIIIPSGDHELHAWLLRPEHAVPTEPIVLVVHGWGANHSTVLQLGDPLAQAGRDVVLFDVRGHGRNPPVPYVTVRHFRDDVMAVVRYVDDRFPERPIVVVGHSLGGSASILAAAEGAPMDALALVAAPADVLQVTAEYLTDKGSPGAAIVTLLRPFLWAKVGGMFGPLTPMRRIGELDLPILMIQPENDQRVHRKHADRLAAAAGVEYHLIPDREHTDVLAAPETFRLVNEFIHRVPGIAPPP